MTKAFTAITAALAIASFISGSAQAMGATSAPSKSSATYGQTQANQASFPITEFSSSSAKISAPKR